MAVKWSNELRVFVGAYDLSLMTTRASINLMTPALDKTVFGDAAESSTGDVARDTLEWAGWFDDQAQGVDALIGTLIGTRGDMVTFVVGTGTGARAYAGTLYVSGASVVSRIGELVRVEGNFKPDTAFYPGKHLGVKQTISTAGFTSTIFDDTALSSGTHILFVHAMQYTTGTPSVTLRHAATSAGVPGGTSQAIPFTAIGSTAVQFTGTLNRFVSITGSFDGSPSGTFAFMASYVRTRKER